MARPTKQQASKAKGGAPPPFSRNPELEALAASCTRFLNGDGPRRVESLLASIPADVTPDYYGIGGVVAELESEVAGLLGKEAALFVPTGTMAQQATLRVHVDRRRARSVAFHPTCHLDLREERGYEHLHGLHGVPVGSRTEPISLPELEMIREPLGALLIELPQRELGGTLPTWDELEAQAEWARGRGAAVHLDGARLWEAGPYYAKSADKSLAEIAGLFDSVYVSFYKGLGAIAGCCVAGDRDVIDELSVWRTRHGGRMFMMWPYAASALTALRARLPLMPRYYRHAVAIGRALRDAPGLTVTPSPVQSPMMHLLVDSAVADVQRRAIEIARSEGIWTFQRPFTSELPTRQRYELQVGSATLDFSPAEVRELLERLSGSTTTSASRRH